MALFTSFLAQFVFSKFGNVIAIALVAAARLLQAKHPELSTGIDELLPELLDVLGLGLAIQSKPLIGAAAVITNDGSVKHVSPSIAGHKAVVEATGK